MQVTKSSIGIQKTQVDKGIVASHGLSEDLFRTERVNVDKAGNERIREIVSEALAGAVTAIAEAGLDMGCEDNSLLVNAMYRNIDRFELCSGTGFTEELKARLKANEDIPSDVWVQKGEVATSSSAPSTTIEI